MVVLKKKFTFNYNIIVKPLFTQDELINASSTDMLKLVCYNCNNIFEVTKKRIIQANTSKTGRSRCKYCTLSCNGKAKSTSIEVICACCNKQFYKIPSEIKRTKNNFCSSSCA